MGLIRGAGASTSCPVGSFEPVVEPVEGLRSTDADASSKFLDWLEATESRWPFRAVVGLDGKTGKAGMTGATGRLLG